MTPKDGSPNAIDSILLQTIGHKTSIVRVYPPCLVQTLHSHIFIDASSSCHLPFQFF